MYLNPKIHDTQDTFTIHVGYKGIHSRIRISSPTCGLRPRLDTLVVLIPLVDFIPHVSHMYPACIPHVSRMYLDYL